MTIWFNLLKRNLKDYKLLFMMSLFPILLTVIFVNMFTTVAKVDEQVNFSVYIEDAGDGKLAEDLRLYFKQVAKMPEADFIVRIDEGNRIEVENTGGNSMEEVAMYAILDQFSSDYGARKVVGTSAKLPLEIETQVLEGNKEKDVTTPLVVTMLIFGILLGGTYGIKQIFYIREAVGIRVLTAPITKKVLYFMEFTASTLIIGCVGIVAAIAYEYLFGVKFSNNLLLSIIMIFIISMIATLLGMTIGIHVKSKDMGENMLSIIITLCSMLSGGLMPNFELGKLTTLSPIKPLADVLNEIVTTGHILDYGTLSITLGLCFVTLVGISILGLRRREE